MEAKEKCPDCRVQMYFSSLDKMWRCRKCDSYFDARMKFIIKWPGGILFEKGNPYLSKVEVFEDKVVQTKTYLFLNGKKTLRGEHEKFRGDSECAHPERASCNSELGCNRCEHMEFISLGNWRCNYKK